MRVLLGLAALAALVGAGCKSTNYVYVGADGGLDAGQPIGKECPNGDECYNGTTCAAGVCTTTCEGGTGCGAGYECRPYPDQDGPLTCLKVSYRTGPGMIGTPCATDMSVCAEGTFCYSRMDSDPDALCSVECADDQDCPPQTYCQYAPMPEGVGQDDGCNRWDLKVCTRRSFCSPCNSDSDCPLAGGLCLRDARGQKFCTTPCEPPEYAGDPKIFQCPFPHGDCQDDGRGGFACVHRHGSCVGDGSLCAPCRNRHDCRGNALCYDNTYSQERFCMSPCPNGDECPTPDYQCLTFLDETLTEACRAQCFVAFDPATTTNPRYPTCYPDLAGSP